MKVIIAGSRTIADFAASDRRFEIVVSDRGVDKLGEEWASWTHKPFPAISMVKWLDMFAIKKWQMHCVEWK